MSGFNRKCIYLTRVVGNADLKIQSTARSTLLSVSFKALMHFLVGMPMASSIARPSALGTKLDDAAPAEGLLEKFKRF